MGRETLRNGGKILTDIAELSPTDAATAGDIVSKDVTEFAQNLISKLRGRCRKRVTEEEGSQASKDQGYPEKNNKSGLFLRFTSVTL